MIANILTIGRMALALPFAALFVLAPDAAPWARPMALGIFLIAAATDYADGAIARARSETSALGAALDPIADKVLIGAGLLALAAGDVLTGASLLAGVAILCREFLVSGLREAIGQRGAGLPVTGLAKWKTTLQLVAVITLIAAAPGGALRGLFGGGILSLAHGLLWGATALTLWTGADYARRAAKLLNAEPAK